MKNSPLYRPIGAPRPPPDPNQARRRAGWICLVALLIFISALAKQPAGGALQSLLAIVVVASSIYWLVKTYQARDIPDPDHWRECLVCRHSGEMSTVLRTGRGRLIFVLLFLFVPIIGPLIYLAYNIGRHVCPVCSAVGKNIPTK